MSIISTTYVFAEDAIHNGYNSLKNLPATIRTASWQFQTVLFLTVLAVAVFYVARPHIIYDDSDPLTYIRDAWDIIGVSGGVNVPMRGPGYPLLLIVSGAVTLDTWWVLIPLQILMAAAVPLLIYGTLSHVSKNAGLAAAVLALLSGIPVEHMMFIMSENLFLFLQFLILFLIARYFAHFGGTRRVMLIAILCALLAMTRSVGIMYFWLFVASALIMRRSHWRELIKPTAVYVVIMLSWSLHDYRTGDYRHPQLQTPEGNAEQLFADIYYGDVFSEPGIDRLNKLDANKGPASKKLFNAVRNYATANWRSFGNQYKETQAYLYDSFETPDALAEAILRKPNPIYFGELLRAAKLFSSDHQELLNDVVAEQGYGIAQSLLDNVILVPRSYFFGPPPVVVERAMLSNFTRADEMRVAQNYFRGQISGPFLKSENGPWSAFVFDSIDHIIDAVPHYTLNNRNGYREHFKSKEELKAYARNPLFMQFSDGRSVPATLEGDVYTWLSFWYGEAPADKLLGLMLDEALAKYPLASGVFYDNFLRGTLMRHDILLYNSEFFSSWTATINELQARAGRIVSRTTILPESLAKDLSGAAPPVNAVTMIHAFLYDMLLRSSKPLFFFPMLLTFVPLLFDTRTRGFALTIALIYAYNIAGFSAVIGNYDEPRYEDVFILMPVILTVLGISVTARPLIKRLARP